MPVSDATLVQWAARAFGDDVAARVIAPLIADWDRESRRAAPRRRHLLRLRWTLALARTIASLSWRHPAPGWRAARAMSLFSMAGTLLLMAPYFARYVPSGSPQVLPMMTYLTPQAVALAVPFAVLPVAMLLGAATTDGTAGLKRRRLTLLTAAVVVVTATNLAWVVPEANQAFREASRAALGINAGALPRGVRELGIVDLWRVRGVDRGAARRELHTKSAVGVVWPVALALLGWRLGRHRRSAPGTALLFWWTVAAAIVVVSEPARHTPYLRESPYLVVAAGWGLAALALRPGGGASWRPDALFLRRR